MSDEPQFISDEDDPLALTFAYADPPYVGCADRYPEHPDRIEPQSDEEGWWRRGGGFRWCWPHLDVYQPADRSWRIGLNRYPHNIIGAYAVAFGRSWGIRWKDSRRA